MQATKLEVYFPCLSGINLLKKTSTIVLYRTLFRTVPENGKGFRYACSHRSGFIMIFSCPEQLKHLCREQGTLTQSAKSTTLQDILVFDPMQIEKGNLARITDKCPRCFFKSLLITQPTCCTCGQVISEGDCVSLHEYNPRLSKKLGVMRVCASEDMGGLLVQCAKHSRSRKRIGVWLDGHVVLGVEQQGLKRAS